MTRYLPLIILLSFSSPLKAIGLDSLAVLIQRIQKGENDSVRLAANAKFRSGFERVLNDSGSFERNFDSLSNLSVIAPEDRSFRIYTWVLPYFDGERYDYFGYIQFRNGRDSLQVEELVDSTEVIKKPESEKLSPMRWIGSVYYGIVTTEKSGVNYYTLFGWKGKNKRETQKIIEVLYFNKHKPQFGYPLLKTESVFRNRMIYTFDSQASMVLHYDNSFGGIVLDHISLNRRSEIPVTGPDGTYDAFKWKKGKWQLYKDVDVRTKWKPRGE
jgi:hypothetical protein